MKKHLLFIFIMLMMSLPVLAERISITADYKHFDKYRDVLICKGNVVVKGEDFRIESPYIIRYFADNKFVAMDKFTFERDGWIATGNSLEYNYVTDTGTADKVKINFGGTYLGCRYMTIDTGSKFEMYDAYYTGCDEDNSHYHVSAQQISLYPKTGLVVAYYATCWVWVAPVLPIPTFVYSAPVPKVITSRFLKKKTIKLTPSQIAKSRRAKETVEEIKTTSPVPDFGKNPVDGFFIRQGLNWYFTPRSYLRTTLSYMEINKGGLDLAANYILSNENEGELRFGSNAIEGSYGGWSHYFSLGEKLITKDDEKLLLYDYYRPGGKYSYELEVNYSYRERINGTKNIGPFGRVSFLPETTLRSNRKPLPILGEPFSYFMEASHSPNVSEEVTGYTTLEVPYGTSSPRTNYYMDINYQNPLWVIGLLSLGADVTLTDYGKLGSWDRSKSYASMKHDIFDIFDIEYGQTHYMMQRGSSPYAFEGYWFSQYDQFYGKILWKFWWSTLQLRTSYNLPSWDTNSIDYTLVTGMHCYNLNFNYNIRKDQVTNEMLDQFTFSFELVPSRW